MKTSHLSRSSIKPPSNSYNNNSSSINSTNNNYRGREEAEAEAEAENYSTFRKSTGLAGYS